MPSRPCNPDSDTKRLWQALLPGVPFPACGDPAVDIAAAAAAAAKPPTPSAGGAEPQGENRRRDR